MSSLSISPCNDHVLTPSIAYTEYCIHRVLHHPKIHCHPLPASLSSLGGPYCTQLSSFPRLRADQWKLSLLPSHLPTNLPPADRPPPSTHSISIDHRLRAHLQTCSIMASRCISEFNLVSASKCISALLHLGLQMHLQTHLITAYKCISGLHDLGLQMHLQTRSIMASKCISEFNWISASKCISALLDLGLQMHLETRSITASKCISELLDLNFQMHFLTHSITASKCISEFNSILAFKCISELLNYSLHMHLQTARSRPPSASLSSTPSRSPCASPNSLDRSLQVHLPVHTITASKCISMFSRWASPDAPAITLQYRLQPDWPYVYV